jgi:hypothetical protein
VVRRVWVVVSSWRCSLRAWPVRSVCGRSPGKPAAGAVSDGPRHRRQFPTVVPRHDPMHAGPIGTGIMRSHIYRLRNALWVLAFASVGFSEGRRWVTAVLFAAAFVVGWYVESLEHPDDDGL